MWVALFALAMADCPSEADVAALMAATDIERAFIDVDEDMLADARVTLTAALPCIDGALTLAESVSLHRAHGLLAFMDGDAAASRRSWSAVRRLEPGWRPSEALAPAGHPVRNLFDSAEPDGETVIVELAPPGGWWIDGAASSLVPTTSAFVMQGFDASGVVVLTGYYASPSAMPIADVRALSRLPRIPAHRARVRRYGTIGAGAVALSAVALGIAAQVKASNLTEVPLSDVPRAERAVRTMGVTAGLLGGTAAVGGAVVWAVKW